MFNLHPFMSTMAARWARVALLPAVVMLATPAHALFGDDEARRAILDLRNRVEANRQAAEDADRKLAEELKELSESGLSATRRSMLDLVNQIEALRRELADVRGQNEKLARDLAEMQRQQRDVQEAVDVRLRPLEPVKVALEGQEFSARPEEKAAFDAAMTSLRATEFAAAARQYGQLLERYPDSGYVPMALYWQGNALYAVRSYKPAIEAYQRLLEKAPNHPRAAEALLAVANCHLELKDAKAARATLQQVVAKYPNSEAASAAKDRLARMR